jgi:diacylglycerol kinase (ATP)
MRVLLVHNPGSGSEDHSGGALTRLFEAEGHEVVYRHAKEDGVDPAETERADLVAIGGGDGTVGTAVRALADVDRPFVILPLGTANNIARCLGLLRPVEEIVRGCGEARERGLDLGMASGPWGKRAFLEGVGLGALAEMIAVGERADSDSEKKKRFGEEAPQRFVREAEPGAWRVRVDGRMLPDGMLVAEMLNMPLVGPGLPLGPAGWPEDGLLYLSILRPEGREDFAAWLEGRRERRAPGIETLTAKRVEFAWDGRALRIDDDFPDPPDGPAEVVLEMARRKLRVLVPREGGMP